jgi:hypothetical protein
MRRTVVMLSASLLLLTACTPTKNGTPSPSTNTLSQPPSSGSADQLPGPGVPAVTNPIDIGHFQQSPCDSLTTEQVDSLLGQGASRKPDPNGQAGPECFWHSAGASQASVGIIFVNADKRGLTSVYQANGSQYKFFKPLDAIDDYPVVAYGVADERNSRGRCTVALGVSDTQAVDINIAQSEENIAHKDPCAAARDVAAKVLSNLKAGK